MRLKRLLYTVSGIGMWISGMSPLQGAGLLPEVCAATFVVRQSTLRAVGQQLSAMRHYSTGMFQGKYLQTDAQGCVSLTQSNYPKYSGVKGVILQPRIIREETIENYDVLCHVLAEDLDGPYQGLPIRIMDDTTEAPFAIETPRSLVQSPYAAFGSVRAFEDSKEGVQEKGVAAASKTPNSLVKLRADVLPFIEGSIAKHQAILENFKTSGGTYDGKRPREETQLNQTEPVHRLPEDASDDEKDLKEIREGLLNLMRETELRLGRPLTERERSKYNISHYVLAQKKASQRTSQKASHRTS